MYKLPGETSMPTMYQVSFFDESIKILRKTIADIPANNVELKNDCMRTLEDVIRELGYAMACLESKHLDQVFNNPSKPKNYDQSALENIKDNILNSIQKLGCNEKQQSDVTRCLDNIIRIFDEKQSRLSAQMIKPQ